MINTDKQTASTPGDLSACLYGKVKVLKICNIKCMMEFVTSAGRVLNIGSSQEGRRAHK